MVSEAESPLETCEECGKPVMNLGAHEAQAHAEEDDPEVDVSLEDVDGEVLIRSVRAASGIAHLKAADGGPLCGYDKVSETMWRPDGWHRSEASNLPNHRLCISCKDEFAKDAAGGRSS